MPTDAAVPTDTVRIVMERVIRCARTHRRHRTGGGTASAGHPVFGPAIVVNPLAFPDGMPSGSVAVHAATMIRTMVPSSRDPFWQDVVARATGRTAVHHALHVARAWLAAGGLEPVGMPTVRSTMDDADLAALDRFRTAIARGDVLRAAAIAALHDAHGLRDDLDRVADGIATLMAGMIPPDAAAVADVPARLRPGIWSRLLPTARRHPAWAAATAHHVDDPTIFMAWYAAAGAA